MSNEKSESQLLDDLESLLTKEWKEIHLEILPENYFSIETILQLPKFSMYTAIDVQTAVFSDKKMRFSVRGLKIRLKPPELNKDPDIILSKKLTWILRHAGEKEGLVYLEGGFLNIDDLLRLPEFGKFSFSDMNRVIDVNDKKRFEMRREPLTSRLQVRAVQGHTAKVDVGLRLITDPYEFPVVLHGTYRTAAKLIEKTGISRMGRSHIHLAIGDNNLDNMSGDNGMAVISGMRTGVEIVLYIDLVSAMRDNIKFYVSNNNVILCEGNEEGFLLPKYILKTEERNPQAALLHVNAEDSMTLL